MKTINKVLEKYLHSESSLDTEKRKAATKMRTWLPLLDHDSELVPENSIDMLSRMLESLKGDKLTSVEWDLVIEIVYHNRE